MNSENPEITAIMGFVNSCKWVAGSYNYNSDLDSFCFTAHDPESESHNSWNELESVDSIDFGVIFIRVHGSVVDVEIIDAGSPQTVFSCDLVEPDCLDRLGTMLWMLLNKAKRKRLR